MIATHLVRELRLGDDASLSAASGLVIEGDRFYVVADDENHLGVFPLEGGNGELVRLFDGDLPARKAERKARKADLEILLAVPDRGLFAMGSGSRTTRERGAWLDPTAGEPPRIIDTAPLCQALRERLPHLNLEGGLLLGDDFLLLQRASAKDPRNALVFVPRSDLLRALDRGRFETSRDARVVFIDLGTDNGLPWTLTDGTALPDGDLLVTAVIEDSVDTYEDGACHGSALAQLSPRGELRWLRRLATTAKVEGVALHDGDAWLVTDADDARVPGQLLRARP